MLKICIWMNIPSHYQSAFFQALDDRDDIDLQVAYLQDVSRDRAAEGWSSGHELKPFEHIAADGASAKTMVEAVDEWRDRTHIICGYFSAALIELFCAEKIKWCHWSEMPGIRLAELLGYRMPFFRFLNPLMLMCKRSEGRRIAKHAVGAFGQGVLARRAFRMMSVPDNKIADLFYVPEALLPADPAPSIVEFSKGRKTIIAVGALSRRKGIDVLLKAVVQIDPAEWCLVLCGLDRSNGRYSEMIRKLGIEDRVLLLGAYPVERIAEVYSAADLCVLASRFDGWGAVLNEAASLGLPLVGTDLCGASWHVIDHGRNGYRVKAGSVDALVSVLKKYDEAPELLDRHGAISRERFAEEFTPERNANRLVSALKGWGCK